MPVLNAFLYACLLLFVSSAAWSESYIVGTHDRDVLLGSPEDDVLQGLEGDDVLIGGAGNDTYLIELDGGHDIIIDTAGRNIIQFGNGIAFSDVANGLVRSGNDITFKISSAQSVTVQNFFTIANTINELKFLAGSSITAQQLWGVFGVAAPTKSVTPHTTLIGTTGNDNIQGDDAHNIIIAGPGDDYLQGKTGGNILIGGQGDDVYFIDAGLGTHLIIDTQGYNKLLFAPSIGFSDAANYLYKSGQDLIIKLKNNDQHSVRVAHFFSFKNTINELYFESTQSSISASQLFGVFGISEPQESVIIHDLLGSQTTVLPKDDDQDGVINSDDLCPDTPLNESVDEVGCSDSQKDEDGDGVVDSLDICPDTTDFNTVDSNGCSAAQRDSDGDGVSDYDDHCSNTQQGLAVDENGCADNQLDSDGDGYTNAEELNAGTDPYDWQSNPWTAATVKSYLPQTGEAFVHADNDDGYYRNGSPRVYRQVTNVVYDEINGLVWEDTASTINNYQTWDQAESYCGSLNLNGIDNWRLPNKYELFYLLSHNTNDLTFFDSFANKIFSNKKKRAFLSGDSLDYWTSSSNNHGSLVIVFSSLSSLGQQQTNRKNLVRCVSGEERFYPYFGKLDSGLVVDKNNKLMWQDNAEIVTSKHTWEQALNYCKNLEVGGFSDWRLPNINEAYSLLSEFSSTYFPAFSYQHRRIGSEDPSFWSSTSYYKSPTYMGEAGREIRPTDAKQYAHGAYSYPGSFKTVRPSKTSQQYARCVRNYADPVIHSSMVPTHLAQGGTLTIDASKSSSPEGSALSYRWANLTSGEELGSASSIEYPMLEPGVYLIRLILTDTAGVSVQKDWHVSVLEKIQVHIEGDLKYEIGSDSVLTATANSANGEISSYRWLDAKTNEILSETENLTLNYTQAGTYQVRLEVTDSLGVITQKTVEVTAGVSPTVKIHADYDVYEGLAGNKVVATSNVYSDSESLEYDWQLDGIHIGSQKTVTLSNLLEERYLLSLSVTDSAGFTGYDEQTITFHKNRTLQACTLPAVADDSNVLKEYPTDDIPWIAEQVADKEQVEKAFNYARSLDPSVSVYLRLPESAIWDAYTAKEKGLYILNAEREARGLKPFSGMDIAVERVAQNYSEYIHRHNQVIGHYNDGRSPEQRMDAESYIYNNRDIYSHTESISSKRFPANDITEDFILVASIYSWLYKDKSWFKSFDWATGPEWGHRDHLLMRGLKENSGSIFDEGVVGFGVSYGTYTPKTDELAYGGIAVFNTVDQRSSWDEARLIKVDTSAAHLCVDHNISLDPEVAPTNLDSIRIFPNKLVLLEGQTATIRVEGQLSDGTSQDLTSQVLLQADRYSIVSITGDTVTAQKTGRTSLVVSVGEVKTTLDIEIYEPLEREALLEGLEESIQRYIPDNAAHWHYDPEAMEPNTSYDSKAVSIYTGLVVDENNQALANVTLSFLNNSRLGSVQTDNNGRFIIAGPAGVNQFNYAMSGRLPVQREGIGSSNSWATLETVMLLPFDSEQSQIDLSSGKPQVHRASVVTDERGTRQATVVFNGITQAKVISRNGHERLLDNFLFSATEHRTPASMPGALPVETAYTYCAELHVDGVKYDDTVAFNGDVIFMVDNFLNFKVGEIVPVGSFNTITSQWDAERNGVIVMAIDSDGDGIVDGLDYTGDGIPDDLNGNGSTTDEAIGLEGYQHGDTLMWSRVSHFSALDLNWSQDGDDAANDAEASTNEEDKYNDEEVCTGSYVMPYQQSFHDDIPVAGTNVTLHYSSQRTADYQHKITVTLSGDNYPERANSMIAKVEVGGHVFERTFAPQANLSTEFIWDGKDIQGNYIEGLVRGRVSVGYEYQTNYLSSGNAVDDGLTLADYPITWATIGSKATAVEGREAFIAWNIQGLELKNSYPSQLAKGWSLSNVHEFDGKQSIYLGSGNLDAIKSATNVLRTGITHSEVDGDDGYYQKGAINEDYYISPLGTMVDRVTGLTWAYSDTPYRTANLWEAVGYCSKLRLAGIQNWRLPTAKERGYSHNKANIGNNAIYQGIISWYQLIDNQGRVLPVYCVSGEVMDEYYPEGMVRNSSTEVVTDKNSGLMWQDTPSNNTGTYDWQSAIQYCESSTHAGFDDWRLPNVNELLYTLPNQVFKHATETPKDFVSEQYWTNKNFRLAYWGSTPSTRLDTKAWGVESDGYSSDFFEKNEDYYVRCVRDDDTILRSPYIFNAAGQHLKTVDIDSGKLITQLTYNKQNRLNTVEDAFGNRITIEYDAYGIPTRIIAPNGQNTYLTIVDGKLVSVRYDDGSSYQFTYDGTLLTEKTDPNGHRYGREYDQHGRVITTTDMEGGEWSFFDNAAFKQQHYGYNTAEGLLYQTMRKVLEDGLVEKTTTHKDGAVTTHQISADELQESYQSNTGAVTQVINQPDPKTLQPIAQTITVTQPSQLASHTTLSKTYGDDNTDFSQYQLIVNHNGNSTIQSYNANTGLFVATSAEGRSITSQQNPANLLLQSQQASGLTATHYSYDAKGRLTNETTGSRTTTYSYNSAGLLASITTPDQQTTDYQYDLLGRVTQVQYPDGNSVQHSYDNNGNHTSLTVPTHAAHSFTYNAVNKVTGVLAPQTASTQYHYDRDRRLTRITLPSGQPINYHYQNGQLVEVSQPEGSTQYRYINGNQLTTISEGSEAIHYQYDGDLLTQMDYSGALSSQIHYGYNNNFAINQLSYAGKSTSLSYDKDGLLTGIHGFSINRHAQHGMPTQITQGNYQQTRSYNGYGETTTLNQTVGSTTLNTDLTYNALGQITQKVEQSNGQTRTYQYQYDSRNRLTQVSLNGTTVEAYGYDANGNRVLTSSSLRQITHQSASYNNGDQLQAAGNQTYSYDANGRLKTKTRLTDDGLAITTTYQYSSDGRLLKVTTPNNTIEYRHNAIGNRVAKLVNGQVTEKYLWQNKTTLLAIYDANNNLKQRFEYTLSHAPTAFTQNGNKYFILSDQLGSPRIITDSSGNIVKEITYDSYGNILSDTNENFELPFGFAGGLQDKDTGLIRFGYRDYDPETGRWTARDPIGFEGGDSNLYGYVLGDPINLVDPDGLIGVVGAFIGAGIEVSVQLAMNGGDIRNIDIADVAIAALVGAVAPGMLQSSKTIYKSGGAIKNLNKQIKKAKAKSKIKKLSERVSSHKDRVKGELTIQAGFQGFKYVLKENIDYEIDNFGCKKHD